MPIISIIKASTLSEYLGRIDAEFYKPTSLSADARIKSGNYRYLGRLVKDGYRVVYENTKILQPSQVSEENDCRFLQATNISEDGLWINVEDIGWVSKKDWERYPKGRIKHGEVLIEVKGSAEKVTIVQDYIPEKTLVTGTVFKLSLKEEIVSHEYLFAFFNSKYGKILRDRTKVNTLIAYVSKPELYRIPVPIPDETTHHRITNFVKKSFESRIRSKSLYSEANNLLEESLGIVNLQVPKVKGYTAKFSDVVSSRRGDAEFYNPDLRYYYSVIQKKLKLSHISEYCDVRKFGNPTYSKNGIPIITQKHLSDVTPHGFGDEPLADKLWVDKYDDAILRTNDLLFYSVGAYLGKTNIWLHDKRAVPASFITLLRPYSVFDAGYLMMLLNSKYGLLQSKVFQSGTSQQYIYPKDIKQFKVPDIDVAVRKELFTLVMKSYDEERRSEVYLEEAKRTVESFIDHSAKESFSKNKIVAV